MHTTPYAFIIRIWIDPDAPDAAAPQWHGVIEQVGSREHLYFSDLHGITRYIQEHTAISPRRFRWWHRLRRWLRHVSHALLRQYTP